MRLQTDARRLAKPLATLTEELSMNWEDVQGQTQQISSKLKEWWTKLTDDDLLLLKGKGSVPRQAPAAHGAGEGRSREAV